MVVYDDADNNYNVYPNVVAVVVVVVVVVCFQYLKFHLSSQLKAASCAWCIFSQ